VEKSAAAGETRWDVGGQGCCAGAAGGECINNGRFPPAVAAGDEVSLSLPVTFFVRVAWGLSCDPISLPRAQKFRSIDNFYTTMAGPHAQIRGSTPGRDSIVERRSSRRSAVPRLIIA